MKIYERWLQALLSSAPRSRVLARLASLAQIGELARRLMAINTQYHQVIIRKIFACGIKNPRKFCLWNLESRALESEIQLKETGIPLTIGIQNSSSTVKDWNPVPGIRNPRRGIQYPRDQDCLGFPFTGRQIFYFHCLVFHFSRYLKKLLNKE